MKQTSNTILMVRPANFRMNEQTAVNNYYQEEITEYLPETINLKAQKEFDIFVDKLKEVGVQVIVIYDNDDFDNDTAGIVFKDTGVISVADCNELSNAYKVSHKNEIIMKN